LRWLGSERPLWTIAFKLLRITCSIVHGQKTPTGDILVLVKCCNVWAALDSGKTPDTARELHQRMRIDSLTEGATGFCMTILGNQNSKMFRAFHGLREWFDLKPPTIMER
jgi:hypothetical protein